MKRLFLFMCFLGMTQIAWCDNQSPLEVQISIVKGSFNKNVNNGYLYLDVMTTVMNISNNDQRIGDVGCYENRWISNNIQFSPLLDCGSWIMNRITLKPGQQYSQKLTIWDANFRNVKLPNVFRLGFNPGSGIFASSKYSTDEFSGEFTIDGLVTALRERGVEIPDNGISYKNKINPYELNIYLKYPLEFINGRVLMDRGLYHKYPDIDLTDKDRNIIARIKRIDSYELIMFNRSLIDRGDSRRSPKDQNQIVWSNEVTLTK